MQKITYSELKDTFRRFNDENKITQFDKRGLHGNIVFKQESFDKPYSEIERTYTVSSANKGYIKGMRGRSIYATCLDGIDINTDLNKYMNEEQGGFDEHGNRTNKGWIVDFCYIIES